MDRSFADALGMAAANRAARGYPGRDDPRCVDGCLFPNFRPKFAVPFGRGVSVFTIGSCFARNIEEALEPLGVTLPTRAFRAPRSEFPFRPNGLLNEFNPGTMARRILDAVGGIQSPAGSIVAVGADAACMDLLLPESSNVSRERAIERRAEIFEIYTHLQQSSVVVMTLGMTDCWYDRETASYLNRMPPPHFAKSEPTRFRFRRLAVAEILPMLNPAMQALGRLGIKVIVTVSPVPLQTTFTADDCIVADAASKATLRVVAERLSRLFEHVDYFPSFEIVRSGGLASYDFDQVHVRSELVARITAFMVAAYVPAAI